MSVFIIIACRKDGSDDPRVFRVEANSATEATAQVSSHFGLRRGWHVMNATSFDDVWYGEKGWTHGNSIYSRELGKYVARVKRS